MSVQGGPLTAGQSIDIPAGWHHCTLDNDLTNDGTITMEASSNSGVFVALSRAAIPSPNAGTFSVPASDGTPAYLYNGSVDNTGTFTVDGTSEQLLLRLRHLHEQRRRLGHQPRDLH